jgi:REP element-mobilizing transposase RayT
LPADRKQVEFEGHLMDQRPYLLDGESRAIVLNAMREVCSNRGWRLLAAHVRKNHVHAVVEAEAQPERVMNSFKSYASRGLNRASLGDANRKRWARHGSTRCLWNDDEVRSAVRYVIEQQGEPMAIFCGREI